MNILSNSAQIEVRDSSGSSHINIDRAVNSYGAELWTHENAPLYVVRKAGYGGYIRLMLIPSEEWLGDVRGAGYEVVGRLADFLPKPLVEYARLEDHGEIDD